MEFLIGFSCLFAVKWLDIHQRVREMLRSVFEAAAAVHPGMHNPMSRAMYGVDVMLDSSFQPKLLEVCRCQCFRHCAVRIRTPIWMPYISSHLLKLFSFFSEIMLLHFLFVGDLLSGLYASMQIWYSSHYERRGGSFGSRVLQLCLWLPISGWNQPCVPPVIGEYL